MNRVEVGDGWSSETSTGLSFRWPLVVYSVKPELDDQLLKLINTVKAFDLLDVIYPYICNAGICSGWAELVTTNDIYTFRTNPLD